MCQSVEGSVFRPLNENWPVLPEPRRKAILFISEAPPPDGGFWTIQPWQVKQDDLREKLLRLLTVSSSGADRGLTAFCDSGYYLLQSFPRPLKISIAGIRCEDLKVLLGHPVKTHLRDQIAFLQPSAILALGVAASTAVSMRWPDSEFARAFEGGARKLQVVRGKTFEESQLPMLSATYLPSGNGGRWQKFWGKDIPLFVETARSRA
ncbi:MAG: hypothetical protein OXM00_03300 [Paracoccaceae bacterium]|nr:hypothetical protein [Paracoccaceae bacterium]